MQVLPRLIVAGMCWIGCGGGGGFPPDAAIDSPPPGGRFQLAWSIVDQNSQPLSCSQVAATLISIDVHNLNQLGGQVEAFGCDIMMATSREFPAGSYEIRFTLKGNGKTIAMAPQQSPVDIVSQQTAMLAPVVFTVTL